MKSPEQISTLSVSCQGYGSLLIRFVIAPLLGLFSGFHTMDFIVGGLYSWPQMSRVIALTFAVVILSYEFVYKEASQLSSGHLHSEPQHGLKAILYSCLLPYIVGVFVLLSLVIKSQ